MSKVIFDHLKAHGFNKDMPAGVYVVQVGQCVKIGVSEIPLLRWTTLLAEWPVLLPLKIITLIVGADEKAEKALHRHFHKYRTHGEWFLYCGDEIESLRGIKTVDELREWYTERHP